MNKPSKPIGKWVLRACLFGVGLYAVAYLWGSHSEAFQFVEQAIKSSPAMELRVGHVEQVSLDPVGGYREKFVNANKSAYMMIDVTGAKGKITVKVAVKKTDGTWEVTNASIDGQPIALE